MNNFSNEISLIQPAYPKTGYDNGFDKRGVYERQTTLHRSYDLFAAAPTLANGLINMQVEDMAYDGTFTDTVSTIARPEFQTEVAVILSAARLVRAVIDAKIQDPFAGITFDTVRAVTEGALDIFRDAANGSVMENILCAHPACDLPEDTRVVQRSDSVTYTSSKPDKITAAATALAETVGDENVLFLSLCHGGLMAGAGTYLTRELGRPRGSSLFYPVRFSRYKHNDVVPNLTPEEIERLSAEAFGRTVVVFDEDMCSGKTADDAQTYFTNVFGCPVVCITANDMRNNFGSFKETFKSDNYYEIHEGYKENISYKLKEQNQIHHLEKINIISQKTLEQLVQPQYSKPHGYQAFYDKQNDAFYKMLTDKNY